MQVHNFLNLHTFYPSSHILWQLLLFLYRSCPTQTAKYFPILLIIKKTCMGRYLLYILSNCSGKAKRLGKHTNKYK